MKPKQALAKNQKDALFIIFLYILLGPFIGTVLTAVLHGGFNVGLLFFAYAFGVLVAAFAGGISSLLVDSFNNSGKEPGIFTGLLQGIKSGIITVIIFCGFTLIFYGVPKDWADKLLWFSSICVFSAMICGVVINNIVIHEKKLYK